MPAEPVQKDKAKKPAGTDQKEETKGKQKADPKPKAKAEKKPEETEQNPEEGKAPDDAVKEN